MSIYTTPTNPCTRAVAPAKPVHPCNRTN